MKSHCIKIYTTKAVARALAKRAQEEGRSISKHGEFIIKRETAENKQKEAKHA